jgi:hypothetical protein
LGAPNYVPLLIAGRSEWKIRRAVKRERFITAFAGAVGAFVAELIVAP